MLQFMGLRRVRLDLYKQQQEQTIAWIVHKITRLTNKTMKTHTGKNIASTAAYSRSLSVSLAHLFMFFTSVFMQIYEHTYSLLSYIESSFFVIPLNFFNLIYLGDFERKRKSLLLKILGNIFFSQVQTSHSVMSDSLQHHGMQHAKLPCPSPTPRACSNSCPLSQWCHPTISSSVIPFFSRLQSFPESEFLPMSQFFISGSQSIGVLALVYVLSMNIQTYFLQAWQT